jgi:hypothetical protein
MFGAYFKTVDISSMNSTPSYKPTYPSFGVLFLCEQQHSQGYPKYGKYMKIFDLNSSLFTKIAWYNLI